MPGSLHGSPPLAHLRAPGPSLATFPAHGIISSRFPDVDALLHPLVCPGGVDDPFLDVRR